MKKWDLHILGLILLLFFLFCHNNSEKAKEPISEKFEIDEKPIRSTDENKRLICYLDLSEFRNSKVKIKHIGERLISIDNNVLEQGDSTSYDFNSNNQITQEEVFTNENKLKVRTTFQINEVNQLVKISSKDFDGGSPITLMYIYNELNQIIEEKNVNSYCKKFKYDKKNYLTQEEEFGFKDRLLKTTNYNYDNIGNLTSIIIKSNSNDTTSITLYKYNKLKQVIESEHRGYPINCSGRNKWESKYNEYGDEIENKTHGLTVHYKYNYDSKKNWFKKYTFYNEDKSPNFLITRNIEYRK